MGKQKKFTFLIFEDDAAVMSSMIRGLGPLGMHIISDTDITKITGVRGSWQEVHKIFEKDEVIINIYLFESVKKALEVILSRKLDSIDVVIADWQDKGLLECYMNSKKLDVAKFEYIVSTDKSFFMGLWIILAARALYPLSFPILITSYMDDLESVYDGKHFMELVEELIGTKLTVYPDDPKQRAVDTDDLKQRIWQFRNLEEMLLEKASTIIRDRINISDLEKFVTEFKKVTDRTSIRQIWNFEFREKDPEGCYWTFRTLFPITYGQIVLDRSGEKFTERKSNILGAIFASSWKHKMLYELFMDNENLRKKFFHANAEVTEEYLLNDFESLYTQKVKEYNIQQNDTIVTSTDAFIEKCRELHYNEGKIDRDTIDCYKKQFRVSIADLLEGLLLPKIEEKDIEDSVFAEYDSVSNILYKAGKRDIQQFIACKQDVTEGITLLLDDVRTASNQIFKAKVTYKADILTISISYNTPKDIFLEQILHGSGSSVSDGLRLLRGYCDVRLNVGGHERCLHFVDDAERALISGRNIELKFIFTLVEEEKK